MAKHRTSMKKREKQIARSMGKYKSKSSDSRHRSSAAERFARYEKEGGYETRHNKKDRRRYHEDTFITGTFSYSGKGFGFCVPDGEYKADDVFVSSRKTMGAMTGDRVKVKLYESYDDSRRSEGEVVSVEYLSDSIIGTLYVRRGYAYVIPDNKRWGVVIYVPEKDVDNSDARDGYKVEVCPSGEPFFTRTRSITVRGPKNMPYFDTVGRITRVFGPALSKDANYAAILHSAGIRTTFPTSALSYAEEAANQPIRTDGRVDLRNELIFTIDGAGAKDLDDAVSLEIKDGKRILGVHIADVSHYVRQNSPTEEEARARGTSVYFTDKVVPMLPESLSNGACSLNAGEDKYALSAEITLDERGNRLETRIFKSVIRSAVRGVYSEVNDLFESGEKSEFYEKYKAVYPTINEMHRLYLQLKDKSDLRGVLELEDSEAVILLNEAGQPVDIVRRERGDGERLIEQFMLQANMGVAEVLSTLGLPCLYRTHDEPSEEKMKSFAAFAHNVGLDTRGITLAEETGGKERAALLSQGLGSILSEAAEKGIAGIVSEVMLRAMMKAKYQSVRAPHFGLGADNYCHFTSPIRRYPDLFVHTVITAVLEKTGFSHLSAKSDAALAKAAVPQLEKIADERGISSSDCEVRAQNAEREIEDMYMTLYMADKVGEEFEGAVSGVIRSGVFVRLDNLVEGFLPAAAFPGAKINDQLMTMHHEGKTYTLGTRVEVVLVDADVSTGKITFGRKI